LVEVGAEVVRIKITSEYARHWKIEVAGAVMPRVALEGPKPINRAVGRVLDFVELILDESEARLRSQGRLA
jgi:hypothetical protein